MPPVISVYFTYEELNNGKRSTLEEFRACLSQYSRNKVVYACSALGAVLKSWEGGSMDMEAHEAAVRAAFPPQRAEELVAGSKDKKRKRCVFHRQQLLFVAKEAVLACSEQGLDPLSLRHWGGLGRAFLMANDHLHQNFPPTNDLDKKIINTLAEFVPILESSGWHNFANKVGRTYIFLNEFAPKLSQHSSFVDVDGLLNRLVGVTTAEYQALSFGAFTKYMQMDLASFRRDPHSFVLDRSFFRNTAMSQVKVNSVLEDISATADACRDALRERNHGSSDFTVWRNKPLFQDGDSFYAIDTAFLAEKIETGPFWRVHNSLQTKKEKDQLHAFWGVLFQTYMDWLLSEAVDSEKNRFYASPRFVSNGEEVCDGLILCGASAALLEYKGSTFTAEGKYGGNPSLLQEEIEKKLVGSPKNKKGVRQLAAAIPRVFGRKRSDSIQGVDVSGVRRIYPVLITRDDIGETVLINRLLNKRFQKYCGQRSVRPCTVTPLFCLSAEAAEAISAYLKEASFTDILKARYKKDPSLRSTFLAAGNEVLESIGPRKSQNLDRKFHEFGTAVANHFFPGQNLNGWTP